MPLRQRLSLVAAAAVALAIVVAAVVCYMVVRSQLLGQIDSALQQQAGLVSQLRTCSENSLATPPLDSVVLHLLTEYNVSGGPKFKVLIFSFGKTWERQRSNELVITLKPPKPSTDAQVAATPSLAGQLVAAIVAAAQGVRDAETGTPPLQLATLKAEFGFVVKESSTAGVKFEIVPVSGSKSISNTRLVPCLLH